MSDRFVVVSGCSGGGKSTLLTELARRGFDTVAEAGRRLLRQELAAGGTALPWVDPTAFLHRMVDASLADRERAAAMAGPVFFDRSLIDALSGLDARTGGTLLAALGRTHRYRRRVFLTPPWPEIYVQDEERRHDFAAACREHDRLARDYPALGYETIALPRLPVPERADWLLAALDA